MDLRELMISVVCLYSRVVPQACECSLVWEEEEKVGGEGGMRKDEGGVMRLPCGSFRGRSERRRRRKSGRRRMIKMEEL